MWDNLMFLVVLAFSGLMICGITVIMVLSHIHNSPKNPRPLDEHWDKFI